MWSFLRQRGRWIGVTIATWCFTKQLFLAIKLWGVENTIFKSIHLPAGLMFTAVAISGIIDGIVFSAIDIAFDKFVTRLRFAERVITKTFINFCVGITLTVLLIPIIVGRTPLNTGEVFSLLMTISNAIVLFIYMLVVTFLLQFVKVGLTWIQTHDLAQLFAFQGEGVEEDRIFMFLDMKSSTSHAERLGPVKYSLMIQDCFHDLSDAAIENDAELYQYVGDEVIFTWRTSDINFSKSIELFFGYRKRLSIRSEHYKSRYGLIPEFKAGIHHGKVIRTFVGAMRKATAFHGDVVNTAARIQGKCSELKKDILISTAIMDGLPGNYNATWEGNHQLRGKDSDVGLFSIEEAEDSTKQVFERRVTQTLESKRSLFPSLTLWLNFMKV